MSTPNRWAVRSVARASFYSLVDGKMLTYLDTLKSSGMDVKSSTVYARGGDGNVKLVGFSSDKETKITLQDALFDNGVMALLTGNTLVEGSKNVYKREVITVTTHAASLSKTPVGNLAGVFILNGDGSNGKELTHAVATVATGEYDVTAKALTTFTDIADGTKLAVYYKVASGVSSKTIKVSADAFGSSFLLILEVLVTDILTKSLYPAQIKVFNCKIEDSWKLEFKPDGDPAVLDLPIEVLKDPSSTSLWEMTIYDDGEIV